MEENELLNIDTDYDISLRPKKLVDFIGQADLKEMLHVFIQTALHREETLDHVLLFGPPGLGKTTLASIIANEMGTNIYIVSGPSLDRVGDLAAILSSLDPGDVLFIDEIHRIPRVVEEVLYSAMEDFAIDIITGKDSTATTLRIELPPFTLVGATTRVGDITAPLRDRFGIVQHLDYYNSEDLQKIIMRTAKVFNFKIAKDAAFEIAKRSRGTPRIANRLFKRVRDFAQFEDLDCKLITLDIANKSLEKLLIDSEGLNITDRRYLKTLIEKFNGGPAGLNAIASTLAEDSQTLEDVIEPFLLKNGFITRTPRGRVATEKAYKQLKIGMYEYES
ncbi:MAG TPA: Holliday junction branch migration DNA helicase RuvB [Bacilli bacterium]|jgi:Holliday junction DNA helicase RuvB|nr:Holliday junction branch migration DNA helicase RuvB [Bacilli bacterium]HHV14574.1 Holliday junction branch migration DNA helicase RuvB [Acholeplasmataceae bacterium]HNZ74064.1 Holliday junction branch migration DNA helicase RuvB [Bacilli bacterium]HPA98939.1 Holliday junction branch migration DNA helicase RuvB [Bacilli bacterium]HPX83367.1 Holliday junction branch migration DNA helicase RuvB [Bacilli bacterium]